MDAFQASRNPAAKLAACQRQRADPLGDYDSLLPLSPVLKHPCDDSTCNCAVSCSQLFGNLGLGSPSQVTNFFDGQKLARQEGQKRMKRERQVAAAARKQAKAAKAAEADTRGSDDDDDDDDDDDGLSPSRPHRRRRMPTSMSSTGSREDPIQLDSDMSDW